MQVDVIFEMGGALDPQWLDLMRARGKKVVLLLRPALRWTR